MGFLQKLKSMLGFGRTREPPRGRSRARGRESDVTVERQPSTESEEAVKRSQPGAAQGTAGQSRQGSHRQGQSRSQPQGQSRGQSQGQSRGQPQGQSPADTAEPASVGEGETGEPAAPGDDGGEGAAGHEDATPGTEEDVTVIKGIGPAYGDRLEAVGIDTVADLATADAGEIAAETDLSEKRVSGWIDRARDR